MTSYDARRAPLIVGRVPLLPMSTITGVFADPEPLEALKRLIAENLVVRQALRIASDSLAEAIDAWMRGEPLQNPATPYRALAYVNRMASRPTPFGICAGIGIVEVGEGGGLLVDEPARRTCTRPDMGLISEIVAAIEAGPNRGKVSYVTNPAVIERGGRLYVTNVALITFEGDANSAAAAQVPVSLKNTAAVRFVRELARTPIARDDLVRLLAEKFEAATAETERVVEKLIEAGVVISELRASPVGDPVAYVRGRIAAIDPESAQRLDEALDSARQLDATPLTQRAEPAYRETGERFAGLIEKKINNPVQIDMHVPFQGELPAAVLAEVERVAEFWVRFSRVASLEKLRERFESRYEGSERMVPLLEMVDPNVGLGVPDPMRFKEVKDSERDAVLLRIACEASRSGAEEVVLSDAELKAIAPPSGDEPLPVTAEIGFGIAAESTEAMERGEFELVPAVFSATDRAGRSLGRFAHLFDRSHRDRIREAARIGLDDGTLTAELSFVPSTARMYNVIIRPELFDAMVPIGIGQPCDGQTISPDDLWVGLDRGRFFLWSKSLGQRVVTRESHLFNTEQGAPNICRFLSSVGSDGRRFLGVFDWGAASQMTYLPRVRSGKTILSVRRWQFRTKDLGKNAAEAAQSLARWRTLWSMPRYVYLTEGDNRLLLDLDSPVTPALLDDQRSNESLRLEEALPEPSRTWLQGPSGRYAAEFVATLVRRAPVPAAGTAAAPPLLASRRRFGFGSEWVYAKLYMGEQAFDDFLVRAVAPLLAQLGSEGKIDRWFFLRYADPQPHLRLRVRAVEAHAAEVRERVAAAAAAWLEEERVLRYAFDTYDPEYERYGGPEHLDAAERFFCVNSEICVNVLGRTEDTSDARVAAAVESFLPLVSGEGVSSLVLDALKGTTRRKLEAADREALKRLANVEAAAPETVALLEEALEGSAREHRFGSLFHMHCNRLGVRGDGEERAMMLLRSAVLSRTARRRSMVEA